jgi:hypothetical protein
MLDFSREPPLDVCILEEQPWLCTECQDVPLPPAGALAGWSFATM